MKSEAVMNPSKHVHWLVYTGLFVVALALFRADPSDGVFWPLLGNAIFVGLVVWGYLKCRNSDDEVVRAANNAAMSIGAPIGLGLAFVSLFVVRQVPAVKLYLDERVGRFDPMDALSAGFGMGILYTCLVVAASVMMTWVAWWVAKR